MTIKISTFPSYIKTLILIFIIFISLALPFLSNLAITNAQTDEPDWGDIRGIRAITALPTLISFRVRLLEITHDQVQRVTLTIQQNETTVHEVDLDLDDSIFIDFLTEIEYEYNWQDLINENLELYQPLYYEFEVETVAGDISTAGEEIEFEHEVGAEWQHFESDQIAFHYYDEGFIAQRQADTLLEVLNLLTETTGYSEPINMVIYDTSTPLCIEQFNEESGETQSVVISDGRPFPCSLDDFAALYQSNGITLVTVDISDFIGTSDTLASIVVNQVYDGLWDDNNDIPAWFRYGLTRYYAPNGYGAALGTVKRASQQDRLIRLPEMTMFPDETASDSELELWQAQAYVLTLYLAENYGADAPFELATLLSDNTPFLDALSQVADASLERIYSAWTVWVNTNRAEEVILWNPYKPITPTPTATFTATDIPPTRTATVTRTITLTPSDTPVFVPATLRVTFPSLTPTPTASNTPLPPGAFDNPTPVASPDTNDSNGGLCGTGIGALVLPVAGMIFAQRKRKTNN